MTDNNVTKLREPALIFDPRRAIEQAISNGSSVEILERLLVAQVNWEQNEARKAFHRAIAAFKANPPAILKTVEVGYDSRRTGEKTSYKHEDLAEMLAVIDPALAAHGLWLRFKMRTDDNKVTVTAVIGHEDGYSEEPCTLSCSPDTSGNKNHVQAIGSAVAYLQRYTAKGALGLAAARDDDGRASGRPVGDTKFLSAEQIETVEAILADSPEKLRTKLLELADVVSVAQIQAVKFDAVMKFLRKFGKKK